MLWYLQDHLRSRQEREALEQLVTQVQWLSPGEWRIDESLRLSWDANISVAERTYPVTLRYPNHFPHSPPSVLPRGTTERWSAHQYGAGGELCLEYGPDNWHSDVTGAALIESAHRLLEGEALTAGIPQAVPSRHATTLGQDLRSRYQRLLVTRGLRDVIASLAEMAVVEGKIVYEFYENSMVYSVASLSPPDSMEWANPDVPKPVRFNAYEQRLLLIQWPVGVPVPSVRKAGEFRAALRALGFETSVVPLLLLVVDSGIRGFRLYEDGDAVYEIFEVPAQPGEPRMDADHAVLTERTVAIAGCGSLGSKVAVMLARAGVGKFLLVDDDIMFPDNLVRHELDWRDLGTHKAEAVARRIQLVNPRAECRFRCHRLGGQESGGSIESLIGILANSDLIIEATADAKARGYVDAAVATGKKPLVWAEVFGGGIGGLVARHRPTHETDPASMRREIENWCRERGKPADLAVDYETRGLGRPMTADDADVSVIASHAARLAIDLLIPREPSIFPNSVYMVGLAPGWIFDQPFQTYPINVGAPVEIAEPAVDLQVVNEEKARVMEMLKKFTNETATDGPGGAASGA